MGGVKCEDKCKDIGKEWKKHDEARHKSLTNASKKRKDMVAQAAKSRKEVEDRIQTLGTQIEGAEIKLKGLETELADVERQEKGKVVKSGSGKKGGKMSVLVDLAKDRMEELRENLIRVREERDSSRNRVQELEDILTTFKEDYNPNFNDEGVKRAVRAWEEYAAGDKGPVVEPARDRDLDEVTKSDKDNGLDWEEYEGEDESDTDVREYCSTLDRPEQD